MNSVTKTLLVALAAVAGAVAIGLDLGDRTGAEAGPLQPQVMARAQTNARVTVAGSAPGAKQWVVADAHSDESTRKISRP